MNPSIDDSNIFCLQKGLIFMFGLGTEPVLPEVLLPESKQRPQLLLCVRSLCFKIIPCYVVFLNCFVGRGFITLFSYFHAFYSINTSTMIHPSFSANATHYCENKQSKNPLKYGLFPAPPNVETQFKNVMFASSR